jgi:hypothetical protein
MFKWIAHVVRAWDLGSGPMASFPNCLYNLIVIVAYLVMVTSTRT